jgi:ABC-type transporter Mla subunit MlaD
MADLLMLDRIAAARQRLLDAVDELDGIALLLNQPGAPAVATLDDAKEMVVTAGSALKDAAAVVATSFSCPHVAANRDTSYRGPGCVLQQQPPAYATHIFRRSLVLQCTFLFSAQHASP